MGSRVILFHKPYGVLSQFTPADRWQSLKDYGPFPPGVYPAGRLDADSEGLLLLTDDNALKHRLTSPAFGHPRTYLVQIERIPDESALRQLRGGVVLDGRRTRPAGAYIADPQPGVGPRPVPIRFRKNVPTLWIVITLREGRNRQVRRMTAAVGHPALRLIRTAIGPFSLEGLAPGDFREATDRERRMLARLPEGTTSSGAREGREVQGDRGFPDRPGERAGRRHGKA